MPACRQRPQARAMQGRPPTPPAQAMSATRTTPDAPPATLTTPPAQAMSTIRTLPDAPDMPTMPVSRDAQHTRRNPRKKSIPHARRIPRRLRNPDTRRERRQRMQWLRKRLGTGDPESPTSPGRINKRTANPPHGIELPPPRHTPASTGEVFVRRSRQTGLNINTPKIRP